ncbi:MAG: hypothetical protein M5U26_22655 [Planctomycetota bacterium]|nr:hypothetical protein [Planctomycetota bacterium]
MRGMLPVLLAFGLFGACACGAEEKDPLDKFKEDDLVDIGFCFQEFVKAVDAGDAAVVKAFLAEVPANLAKLDLKKDADKASFLKQFESYKGAQIVSSQRMAAAGIGMVKYADANGAEKEQRMQNAGGRWKLVL